MRFNLHLGKKLRMNENTMALKPHKNTYKNSEHIDLLTYHISDSLLSLGFRAELRGYVYTKDAVLLYIENPYTPNIVAGIYAKISRKYDVTPTSVERAIRYAIKHVWYKDGVNSRHELFNWSSLKIDFHPSNSEFIATMAELVSLKIKRESLIMGFDEISI